MQSLIGADNPFGMDANDPRGQDDVLVSGQELHLPIDQPVKVLLRSKDVLHDFTVPQFRVKMDIVPGMITYLWLTPTKVGAYEILCEELCGMGHFVMRGRVVVDDADAYEQWLAAQPTFAQITARPAADAVAGQGAFAVCTACHGAAGRRQPGPECAETRRPVGLVPRAAAAEFQARHCAAERPAMRSPARWRRWPCRSMTRRSRTSSPTSRRCRTAAQPTIKGDARRGASGYTTCAYCHGARPRAHGRPTRRALSGMSDWYMARQLQQFKQGHRGRHPQDFQGAQMAELSKIVGDGKATNDLLAYINTLH